MITKFSFISEIFFNRMLDNHSTMFFAIYMKVVFCLQIVDQVKNSYYIGLDGSLRLVLANGMEVSLHTEPHLLSGTVNPTISKRNVTLPIDNGLNLVEWRQRKEQARGQVTVYGRRLRVRTSQNFLLTFKIVFFLLFIHEFQSLIISKSWQFCAVTGKCY